jgi:hypothetical protein
MQKIEVFFLHLPLSHPATVAMTDQFEACGFIFAGVMPAGDGKDCLVLQYLNDLQVDFELLKVDGSLRQKLLGDVRTEHQRIASLR